MSSVSATGAIFLAIFFFSLIGTYVIIRRGLIKLGAAALLSGAVNVVALMAFGLTNEEIGRGLAIVGGFVVGLGFTGAMVTMAAFFQNNQSETLAAYEASLKQRQRPPSHPKQE